jgi:hypothetical protein
MTGGRLPVTGAPLGWLIAAALALIGIGAALHAVGRPAHRNATAAASTGD